MGMNMVALDYGRSQLQVDLGGIAARILRPTYPPALPDEEAGFRDAVRHPLGEGRPLRERIDGNERLVVVIPDITRALPTRKLLTWLFTELDHLPPEHITLLSGTGTHRPNTRAEWEQMVGLEFLQRFSCFDHVCDAEHALSQVGTSAFGYPVWYNRHYVEADRRILLGFIEPHFMAGFSGGYKAAFPGVAGLETIMHYHSAANIADTGSTWGQIEGNPTQEHIRAGGSLVPVDFCINVTLDGQRRITGFFCGDVLSAHDAGCAFCRETAMVACPEPFPVVVTSNSGYPLDQNLYQCVKGMSAARQVVQNGGWVLMAGACNDGFPEHGHFRQMLERHESPRSMLETIRQPGFSCRDQWQVQIFAEILEHCRVGLYSELEPAAVRRAHLRPLPDLSAGLREALKELGSAGPVAVLPEGPLTIPYLAGA